MNLDRLREECKLRNLLPDEDEPVEVTPGVYMFYAVPLTHECHVSGACLRLRYYAILLGEDIVIQHTY